MQEPRCLLDTPTEGEEEDGDDPWSTSSGSRLEEEEDQRTQERFAQMAREMEAEAPMLPPPLTATTHPSSEEYIIVTSRIFFCILLFPDGTLKVRSETNLSTM